MRYAYTACDCLIRTCYAPNQLANLAVVQVGHISCAVINVPLGPDTWPRPRTLEPASWALCLTFWRPCWWWHRQLAPCSQRQWHRWSRPGFPSEPCAVVGVWVRLWHQGDSTASLPVSSESTVFLIWHSSSSRVKGPRNGVVWAATLGHGFQFFTACEHLWRCSRFSWCRLN